MKRFFKDVTLGQHEGGWQVLLDGRGVKTAAKAAQLAPTRALGEALAAEWAAQGEEIVPASFPLRDLADYAIDIAGPTRSVVIAAVLRFAESDTLCYRAEPDEALFGRQSQVWEPLVTAAEARWQVRFLRISGVIHHAQPAETLARLEAALDELDGFDLAALHTLASLAASLIIGMAALDPDADGEALWQASELEGIWQAELWGSDAEAEARAAHRFARFTAAMRFARLAKG